MITWTAKCGYCEVTTSGTDQTTVSEAIHEHQLAIHPDFSAFVSWTTDADMTLPEGIPILEP